MLWFQNTAARPSLRRSSSRSSTFSRISRMMASFLSRSSCWLRILRHSSTQTRTTSAAMIPMSRMAVSDGIRT